MSSQGLRGAIVWAIVPYVPEARFRICEMRSIGERLAEHLDIDLEPLVSAKVQEHLDELIGP